MGTTQYCSCFIYLTITKKKQHTQQNTDLFCKRVKKLNPPFLPTAATYLLTKYLTRSLTPPPHSPTWVNLLTVHNFLYSWTSFRSTWTNQKLVTFYCTIHSSYFGRCHLVHSNTVPTQSAPSERANPDHCTQYLTLALCNTSDWVELFLLYTWLWKKTQFLKHCTIHKIQYCRECPR